MVPPGELIQKSIDKFSESRDFTISFVLHVIIVLVFGTTVLFQAVREPTEFVGGERNFVQPSTPPPAPQPTATQDTTFDVTKESAPLESSPVTMPNTTAPSALNFTMPPTLGPVMTAPPVANPDKAMAAHAPGNFGPDGLDAQAAAQIREFTKNWGKEVGAGTGSRTPEFEFTAYIGQYAGGDWNSTVRVSGGRIETGSLPNLLYLMSSWSDDRIKTNYKNVEAIKLDSDEIFKVKPPFIFLTGTRDFKLTEKEVQNLQKYIRMGGAIWGDASLPGLRSRFDIAFRREMRRVIADVDKDFEPIPTNHPIFTRGYFPKIQEPPPGVNFYSDPIQVLRIYGEIAIIYTSNDYGNMWSVGLDKEGKIDTRRTEKGQYVAIMPNIFDNRGVYIRNIEAPAIKTCFEFGTNVVLHLLTRWESKVRTAPTL